MTGVNAHIPQANAAQSAFYAQNRRDDAWGNLMHGDRTHEFHNRLERVGVNRTLVEVDNAIQGAIEHRDDEDGRCPSIDYEPTWWSLEESILAFLDLEPDALYGYAA